jgi:tetratricopeptide (TPR) repeat protein
MSIRFISAGWFLAMLVIVGCQSPGANVRPAAGERAAVVDVNRRSANLFEAAVSAMQEQRFADAEVLLLELTAREPELSGPWANLGTVYLALDDPAAAQVAFRRAVEINPDNCAAYNEMGVMSRQSGDFLTAEANYLACVERVPDFREAYLNLGILYELYLGKLPEALAAYRTYQSLLEAPDRRVEGWVMDLERRLTRAES